MEKSDEYYFSDFTEDGYRKLIRVAKAYYTFEDYGTKCAGPHVLWRHDVDFSMHRALRMAQIEAEEQVKSTFFVMLGSEFYNVFETDIKRLLQEIQSLGHCIALHFDVAAYEISQGDLEALERNARFEKRVLEELLGSQIKAISFHSPDVGNALQYDQQMIGGMYNAYARKLRDEYSYGSDSCGYWRFKRLPDFLADRSADKLQILTHPVWWTTEPSSPRSKVIRSIDGRGARALRKYDDILSQLGRKNVR